jgi:hypothetical protein
MSRKSGIWSLYSDLSRSQIKNTRKYFVRDTVGVVDDLKLKVMRFKLLVSESWYTRCTMHDKTWERMAVILGAVT